jgi:predicted phosphoribosyltransferase
MTSLQKFVRKSKELTNAQSLANQSLIERKTALETQRDNLFTVHQQAEYTKKKNVDAIRWDNVIIADDGHPLQLDRRSPHRRLKGQVNWSLESWG